MPAAITLSEPGLVFVLTRAKQDRISEYHDWYNTEHGPLRMRLDSFQNGYRYVDTSDSSLFLATYDLSRMSGLEEPQYTMLRKHRSIRETKVFAEVLDLVERRLYKVVSTRGAVKGPSPIIMTVSLSVPRAHVDEVNRWYEQVSLPSFINSIITEVTDMPKEHINDLGLIPGWRRTRRFQLCVDNNGGDEVVELLAIHEFDEGNGLDGPQHTIAKSKPWRNRVMSLIDGRQNRRFQFVWEFRAADYRPP
jgi:hypothetical protein